MRTKSSPKKRTGRTFHHRTLLLFSLICGTIALMLAVFWQTQQVRSTARNFTPVRKQVLSANTNALAANLPSKAKVSIDDDPILGAKIAPVTMIIFADHECPFCKRFFTQTLPKLKKKYIDTNQVRFVYRDLPLPFHEPMATNEAMAANCARQQGGDAKYYAYQNYVYRQTKSNGTGLKRSVLKSLADELKLDLTKFELCLKDKAIYDEIRKDYSDAHALGVVGTPIFIIGKTTADGTINGDIVLGAESTTTYEKIIEQHL